LASLFDEAEAIADPMRTRPGFSEADLAPMFSALCRRSVTPGYKDEEIHDLFDLWRDHCRAHRSAEWRGLVERMPHLLQERERLLTAMSLGDMAEPEKVAAGLRVQSLANEIAESYARIQCQDRPPPADAASWT
jgi:hypothetical protein